VIAFHNFKNIEKLPTIQEKHRAWLRAYEGFNYSIAENEIHKMKWKTDPKTYYDKIWQPQINCIKERKDRTRIEFDGDSTRAKECLGLVQKKLEEEKWGYIKSTHKGKCDYLWIEFDRELKDKEKEAFLVWIQPNDSVIDLNFSSSKKMFAVLYATHWRHSLQREMPIKFFEGNKVPFDNLNIVPKKVKKQTIKNKGFTYVTGIKEASKIFTLDNQAERFNEIQPLFYDKTGLFWLWNKEKFKWEIVDEVDILNMIQLSTGKDVISSKNRTEILNALKQKGRLNIPEPIKPTWIQFKDKIWDVSKGDKFEATPKYFVTNPIPWKVSGDPRTPTIDKIFDQWNKESKQLLYELIAYCILPDYPVHRIFCLIGSGLNGKGSFLNLLTKFVGIDNVCSTELDSLISSRFEVTRLHKKLICQMGETNFSEINKTSMLKKLSGGDLIGFEYKNKNPFEDHNYAKIVIATNNLPATTDKTIGFYRRWLIIDFPNQFDEKIDILSTIPDEEFENLATNCVIQLNKILEKREFTNEGTIKERMERYEARSNFLETFLNEFTKESYEGYITKNDFYKKFIAWCSENRHRQMSETSIGLAMKKMGVESDRKRFDWMNDGRGGQARVWVGIEWKE